MRNKKGLVIVSFTIMMLIFLNSCSDNSGNTTNPTKVVEQSVKTLNPTSEMYQKTQTVIQANRNEEITKNQETAKIIIAAIEAYKNDHHVYPPGLSDLVPQYIKVLPDTEHHEQYKYQIYGEDYILIFQLYYSLGSHGKYCTYIARLQFWDCDYGSGDDH